MTPSTLAPSHRRQFEKDGFVVVPSLFSEDETAACRRHFTALREAGPCPGDFEPFDSSDPDPLARYPRLIHPHRWDDRARAWVTDGRLAHCLTALMGEAPYAVQTMFYFKPPGARGQALHQDQFFLRVHPGTCMAAWLAVDDCDEANGCLQVVPRTHTLPVLCTVEADTAASFTDMAVPLPEGMTPVPVPMRAGDVLFFNGQLIHGSYPNTTTDRFRRALIGHYVLGSAERIKQFYQPLLRMDGMEVEIESAGEGGPCGVWVENRAAPEVAMTDGTPPRG
jgi:ectoine hydroxylase-related dioxygenase (phytanoyl-CoA dioxygenase family)